MTNAYEVLGVPRNADQAAIRKSYLRASLRTHPDKNPGREEEAKAEFVEVGQAYSILGDAAKRAAYDRELAAGKFRSSQRTKHNDQAAKDFGAAGKASSTQQQAASTQQRRKNDEDSFQKFADLFDETVGGMSEEELNMAMGVAAAVASVIGSIAGARAGNKNSALSAIGSVIGSAMASQAASTLVKTVHEDSTQRALEKKERDAAIARGESVPERSARGNRQQVFQDAGRAFQNVGASMGGSSSTKRTNNVNTFSGNNATSNSGGDRGQFPWREAAKLATMAVHACAEMKCGSKSSSK